MKKLILLFLISSACLPAQSLQFLEHGTNTPAQANYTRNVDDQMGDEFSMDVKNISSAFITYKIRRRILSIPAGCSGANIIRFCDAQSCYLYATSLSQSNISLDPGALNGPIAIDSPYVRPPYAVKADIEQTDCCGTYIVQYTAFNYSNPSDSASFTITYIVDNCTGIQSQNKAFEIGTLSPNPVSTAATLNYNFYARPQKAAIKVYNTMGALVKELKLETQEGTAVIDVTGLPDGIYFYSLQLNDEIIASKKIIVTH